MELLMAAKPPASLLPVQNDSETLASSSSYVALVVAPFHNRFFIAQTASILASTSASTPKAARPLTSRQERISTQYSPCPIGKSTTHPRIPKQNYDFATKIASLNRIPGAHVTHFLKNHLPTISCSPLLERYLKLQLQLSVMSVFSAPLPSFASETEEISGKINIEAIVVSIDNFFNRYPFFVAGVTFVWLVVIPLAQEYLKKYKYISAVNAFRKLREDANSQLLDIRKKQSLAYLDSPNLKILSKGVVQVEFSEGQEGDFVKEVLKNFQDPSSTVVCVLDNFDGDSLKVAELLFNNGFKEAHAIKGGARGKEGWQAVQETLLPPSVHVYPRKKKSSQEVNTSERIGKQYSSNDNKPQISTENLQVVNNGGEAASGTKYSSRGSLSPYPNYPDLKPPSSPTPSKPQ